MIIRTSLVAKMHARSIKSAKVSNAAGKEQLTAFFCGAAAAALQATSFGAGSGGEEAFLKEFERLLLISFPGSLEPSDGESVH